jgi:quercetin dioxygenase-like cupin family protein
MLEPGAYQGKSVDEIIDDLVGQGYAPVVFEEDPRDSLAPHSHAEHHILVLTQGDMTITMRGQDFVMKPGDKLVIPPHAEHSAQFGPQGCAYVWVEY